MPIERHPLKPGQESVWDYPRPPIAQPDVRRIEVVFNGRIIADSVRAIRVLETSHPPVFYIPAADIAMECLHKSTRTSFCEYKGQATYFSVADGARAEQHAAWCYFAPSGPFAWIAGCFAFYPSKMDECRVDGIAVHAQDGDFYGGWITSEIVGPFKGGPDTWHW